MATKKETKKVAPAKVKDAEKEAKKKARMEALKNRPAVQRPNGKQIDVIPMEKGEVRNYGYPIKNKAGHVGVIITSVVVDEKGLPVSSSVTFVPGNLSVKSKKGHGTLCSPKSKKDKDVEETSDED